MTRRTLVAAMLGGLAAVVGPQKFWRRQESGATSGREGTEARAMRRLYWHSPDGQQRKLIAVGDPRDTRWHYLPTSGRDPRRM